MTTSRRDFLAAGLGLGSAVALSRPVKAIEPIARPKKPHLRLSLAAYSFRKFLNVKNPTMTLGEFAELAASYDIDAIEPTSYYFADTSTKFLTSLKGHCIRLGLDISGSAVRNDFCLPDEKKREQDIAHVRQWVEHTSLMGGKTLRIFAGRVAKGDTETAAIDRTAAAIEKACDHAAKFGVYLALENHGGITSTVDQILSIVKGVDHPWFGVNLDTGNFHTEDPYGDLAKLAPYAVNVQVKTEMKPKGKKAEEADLAKIVGILREANYRGYVALEYEAAEDPKKAVPRYLDKLRELVR